MAKGTKDYIGTNQYCVLCGDYHIIDNVVQTKRKTILFFSSDCFEKECEDGRKKRTESKTD